MKNLLLPLLSIVLFCGKINAQKTHDHKQVTGKKKDTAKTIVKYGIASYYADKFHGRTTIIDEVYDTAKYTAACNVLPLRTWIKVTNLRNKRSVIVRINDRMNPKNKRLVDLSKIAAKKLGYYRRGLTRVKVEVLKNYKP